MSEDDNGEFTALSNFDIDDYFSNRPEIPYNGTFALDQLPKICKTGFYIANLDSSDQDGSHWVAICNTPSYKYCCYYDTFARTAPKEIKTFMTTSGKPLIRNALSVQDITSDLCGYYCISLIHDMHNGEGFDDVIYHFKHNTQQNDDMIEDEFQ